MLSRRQILQHSVSISAVAGLAGCVGGEQNDENSDEESGQNDENRDESTNNENTDEANTESPTPDEEWQRNMPKCSSSDNTFKVRGVSINTGSRTVTASIENIGIDSYELYQVGIEVRNTAGTEQLNEFTDVVLEGGESASFELDSGFETVEEILDVSVSVSGETGFETCW